LALEDYVLARALHVVAIVIWIGGVAFVTTVLLPAVRRFGEPHEQLAFFELVESRFARQARWSTLLAGASGFWLVHTLGAWNRFIDAQYWWMHAMLLVWFVFTLMLFVLEPLWLHSWFRARAARDPVGTFTLVMQLHRVLLAISLLTVLGAAAGSHGWSF
jgi:uncharacterized membrane protein